MSGQRRSGKYPAEMPALEQAIWDRTRDGLVHHSDPLEAQLCK